MSTLIPKYQIGDSIRVMGYDGEMTPRVTDIQIEEYNGKQQVVYYTYHPDKPSVYEEDVLGLESDLFNQLPYDHLIDSINK